MIHNYISGHTRYSIALITLVTFVAWALGAPVWLRLAYAAQLGSVSDTLSDSDLSVDSDHAIAFTTANAVAAGETIKVQFDPAGDAFDLTGVTTSDVSTTGMTLVGSCGAGGDEVTLVVDGTAPDENLEFTVCAGDTVAAGAITVDVDGANKINNPASAGSYVISIVGTMTDSGETRVAILDDVVVTAAVDTSFTFAVTGVAIGQTINGDAGTTTATTTTATSIPFGSLIVGGEHLAAQTLSVTTNALNGFVVTVLADGDLTASNGADINSFADGAATAVPAVWAAPGGSLGTPDTYGHWGLTSEDDLNTDEFGSALYVGNFSAGTPRQVFEHNGPADGSTADQGQTRVGYKIEISSLQEAGNDYTATLTYVATPTF